MVWPHTAYEYEAESPCGGESTRVDLETCLSTVRLPGAHDKETKTPHS